MKSVKLLKDAVVNGSVYAAGAVVDVDDEQADELVRIEAAEISAPAAPAPKSGKKTFFADAGE